MPQVCYTPVANLDGISALEEAIRSQERATAKELWQHLTLSLNETTAPLMTQAIRLLAERMPTLVRNLLVDTERTLVKEEATFRTTLTHALVTGSDQLTLTLAEMERTRSNGTGAATNDDGAAKLDGRIKLWDEILPAFDPTEVQPVRA